MGPSAAQAILHVYSPMSVRSVQLRSSLNSLPAEVDVLGHGLVAVPVKVGVPHAHVAPLHARRVARLPVDRLNTFVKLVTCHRLNNQYESQIKLPKNYFVINDYHDQKMLLSEYYPDR